MKTRWIAHVGLGMVACTLAGTPAEAQERPAAPPNEGQYGQVAVREDIIVTASKREERLQDVPAAITALSADTLREIGASQFRDYVALVPGLSQRDAGNPGQGTIILRGLNTGAQQLTNTTATYIDEVPFSASGFTSAAALLTPDPDIADLDRIEVLKGPQGTLYGANALGGLLRIVTRQPELGAVKGFAQVEGTAVDGGGTGGSVRGWINLPIGQTAVVRVNGVYRRAPGWVDNVGTGERNVNRSDIYGGRIALRWSPTDRFTLTAAGYLQNIDNKGIAQQDNFLGTLRPIYGRDKFSAPITFPGQINYRIGTGTATYDLGRVSLIGTASYGTYKTRIYSDATFNYVNFYRAVFGPAAQARVPADSIGRAEFSPNMDKFSAEVRLVSERVGPVEFLAGAFYTDERNKYYTNIIVLGPTGTPLAAPNDVLLRTITTSNYKELAGFGNLTLYLAEAFDVTGGVRFAHNKQFAQTGGGNAITFFNSRAVANFNFKDDVTTYLATARFRPSRNVSLYLRAASGYRPGGPQTNPAPPAGAQLTVDPDTIWNYEGGVKATTADGRFAVNASVFHIDWSKIQLSTLFGGIVLQGNGGEAKVDGFEFDATLRPTDGLSVAVTGGYTNARITRVDPGVRTSIGANTGDKLPLTPDWTVAAIVDQRFPLGGDTTGSIGATLRFRADMPSSYPGGGINQFVKIPEMTTLDLRASANVGRFQVQGRVENVFNDIGYTTVSTGQIIPTQIVPTQATVIRPRSFTLSLSTNF